MAEPQPWTILALSASPIARPALDLHTLLDLGRRPADGYPASIATLRALAENTLEVTDALIAQPRPSSTPTAGSWADSAPLAADDDLAVLAASSVVIARVAAGPWRVWLPHRWLTSFAVAFPGSREVEPATTPLTR